MLEIISYNDNILQIKEQIKDEGHTLITGLQSIIVNNFDEILGYNHPYPDNKTINLFVNSLDLLKRGIDEILKIYENINDHIEKIKINENHLIIYFENINVEIINSIRRVIISEIETIAFDDIEIIKNETFIPDEIWKQRIQLIPIKNMNKNKEFNPDEYFELKKDFNEKDKNSNYVISDNLKYIGKKENIIMVHNDIILGKLNINQSIHTKCYYKEGTGNENIKWSPVTNIPYCIFWDFHIKNKDDINIILPYFITYNINIINNKKFSIRINNKKLKNIMLKIIENNNFKNKVILNKIIKMEIKSVGQYNSFLIFEKAITILRKKYIDFQKKLNNFGVI